MANIFHIHKQATDTKQPSGYLSILHRLVGFFVLTEEEQTAAGIYLGYPDSRYDKDPEIRKG